MPNPPLEHPPPLLPHFPPSNLPAAHLVEALPDDDVVMTLLQAVPEFTPAYVQLVTQIDDAPGGPAVFAELAEFVADRLAALETEQPSLQRALAMVELVAGHEDGEALELVGYAFLDNLSPDDLRRVDPWLGPHTRRLLDELDGGAV